MDYENWIKDRKISLIKNKEGLCYCGHTFKCECANPDKKCFNEAIKNKYILLYDKNNGWKRKNK